MHSDKLPITGPCPIDLDAIGFDRTAKVAHCQHCAKNVTVLSNMTRGEAREFLRANKGKKLCVSYARDAGGRIRFRDEAAAPAPGHRARGVQASASGAAPGTGADGASWADVVPLARLRSRPTRAAGVVAALGLTAAMAACTPHADPPTERRAVVQVDAPETDAPKKVEPEVVEPIPEPVPLAGEAMIPEDVVDGEMEIPDPDQVNVDEPCDGGAKTPTQGAKTPTRAPRGMQVL